MEYRLDGSRMCTRQAAHDEIAAAMGFPEYYGRNLDALWDMLTTASGEVVLTGVSAVLNALGEYGCRLVRTFYDAAEHNSRLTFRVGD